MKTRLLIILIVVVGMVTAYVIYSEIPKYGATANGAPKTNPYCEGTIQHGFFSEVPIIEELILDHMEDSDSRLALEIPFNEFESYRNFMIKNFGEPNPDCFVYEYQDKQYDVTILIGPKGYFTHSFFP
ncbi:MAG: hypothetical protein ACW9W4_07890 [Candidatus Nitrosopumilus sp. bin_7KS]